MNQSAPSKYSRRPVTIGHVSGCSGSNPSGSGRRSGKETAARGTTVSAYGFGRAIGRGHFRLVRAARQKGARSPFGTLPLTVATYFRGEISGALAGTVTSDGRV